MIINKYELKKIYILSQSISNIRQIKKSLKEIYNIDITSPKLNSIIKKIPRTKSKYDNCLGGMIIYMYINCKNTEKLIIYLNKKYNLDLTINALKQLACKKGFNKKQFNSKSVKNVSKETELEIVKLYLSGISTIELAKRYGYKQKKSILDILEQNNIKRRKSSYNQEINKTYRNFSLKEIDTFEKAYFVGLMLTDGYVCEKRNNIGLDLTDYDVMSFLSNYINVKLKTIKPLKNTHKEKYRITLYGKNYIEECKRLGIVENKTFTTNGCQLNEKEEQFIPYIIRGIIDGDGWIRKDGKEFFISSASKDFIKWCETILINLGMSVKYSFIKNEYNGIYLIRTASKENIKILKEKIYDTPFGMKRKFDRLYQEDVQRL